MSSFGSGGAPFGLAAMVRRGRAMWKSGVRATPMGAMRPNAAAWQIEQPIDSLSVSWYEIDGGLYPWKAVNCRSRAAQSASDQRR
jgi:hypothetical protein